MSDYDDYAAADPREATRNFVAAWNHYEFVVGDNRESAWRKVLSAYETFRAHLSKDESRVLWQTAKQACRSGTAGPSYRALYEFGEERSRRYRRTDGYRRKERERDARRAKSAKRQAQVQKARAKYRARQKAERGSKREDVSHA